MEFQLTKIGAAVDQLDWAIRLFLDQKAYVAAITLAGAAEEIIGSPLENHAAFRVLKTKLAADHNLSENVVGQEYINKAKNWLKHWDGRTDQEKITLELDDEAIQYIVRALTNLANYDGTWPSERSRFKEWLSKNRPDLWE